MSSIAPSSHTKNRKTTDDWITPQWLIWKLGSFDLDPCESRTQPWKCATKGWSILDDGLHRPWKGSVWLNPPYGRMTAYWLRKMAEHNNGIALVFARTETKMFFESVWDRASCILFLEGRLTFCRPDGSEADHNSGGPSVLIGYGGQAVQVLRANRNLGAFVVL